MSDKGQGVNAERLRGKSTCKIQKRGWEVEEDGKEGNGDGERKDQNDG